MLALVRELRDDGEQEALAAMEADAVLWPRLRELPIA